MAVTVACWGLVGCGSSSDAAKSAPSGPFVVSDYYVPAAVLQDAPGNVTLRTNTRCKARPPSASGDCYAFEFTSDAALGALWQYPKGNYGEVPGLPLPANVTRVSFWAASDPSGQWEFSVGYPAREVSYSDSFLVAKQVAVTPDWQRYELFLPTPAPTALVSAFRFFGFATAGQTLYLDDLVFE